MRDFWKGACAWLAGAFVVLVAVIVAMSRAGNKPGQNILDQGNGLDRTEGQIADSKDSLGASATRLAEAQTTAGQIDSGIQSAKATTDRIQQSVDLGSTAVGDGLGILDRISKQ